MLLALEWSNPFLPFVFVDVSSQLLNLSLYHIFFFSEQQFGAKETNHHCSSHFLGSMLTSAPHLSVHTKDDTERGGGVATCRVYYHNYIEI